MFDQLIPEHDRLGPTPLVHEAVGKAAERPAVLRGRFAKCTKVRLSLVRPVCVQKRPGAGKPPTQRCANGEALKANLPPLERNAPIAARRSDVREPAEAG